MARSPARPPSMQDVAAAAGVHQTTVSLALRNDRRLPEATRRRIQRIAQKMNYRSHPLVAALVALRRARRPPRFHATLAFVMRTGLYHGLGEQYLAGARATAEQQGYKLDPFVLGEADLSDQRLNAVLRARNIHGVIIAPLPEARGYFNLDWGNFCSVSIEYTFTAPVFDRVVHDNYGGMRRIMDECRRRDVRRVGLVLSTDGHERTQRMNGAAYWVEQRAGFFAAIPPLIQPAWDEGAFTAWHRRHRPEAVVTSNFLLSEVQEWSAQRRLRLGRDLQLVNVNAAAGGPVSGIFQNPLAIGSTAARLVIEKIIRNDRGVPAIPQTTITPGSWVEGTSLRPPRGSTSS
ncbi:MAG TPA: LacI family DNA-binding transcriptional regulator [Opitutaceae bacterium]|nr:LacI family DNA-binding transcriptional regulator [Opitutaceae bacterium]